MSYSIESDIEGYVALAIAIFGKCGADEAFRRFDGKKARKTLKRSRWTEENLAKLEQMRADGKTWDEISEAFGVARGTVTQAYERHIRSV